MDGPRDCHTVEISQKEKQILFINAYMWNLEKNGIVGFICRAEIDTDI